jgi:hypothetical protein
MVSAHDSVTYAHHVIHRTGLLGEKKKKITSLDRIGDSALQRIVGCWFILIGYRPNAIYIRGLDMWGWKKEEYGCYHFSSQTFVESLGIEGRDINHGVGEA